MDHIQAMRVFVRIVETENFSRTAEGLGLPRATVSQTLKRLELRLGVRLAERTTRQVRITDEGRLYYQRCTQLLSAFDESDVMFTRQQQQPSGQVRIDMPHSMARELVIPALPAFYRQYPRIRLVLSANDAAINVQREGVDCVVRAWQLEDDSLSARQLPSLPQLSCASAGYCAEHGLPSSLAELAGHRMVGYFSLRNLHRYPLEFVQDGQLLTQSLPTWVDVSGVDAYIAAAQAGLGIIQGPRRSLRPLIERGELVEILPDMPPPPMPLYIMFPAGRFLAPRIQVVVDWLHACIAPAPVD
ncbi:LysR family transcriptional regulator [Lonsdalea quercina]|uniref:LysR family transcriptional regulator n=1 Tax=Lonsdalea quercina TaxID=71657 RepID=UPI003976E6C0